MFVSCVVLSAVRVKSGLVCAGSHVPAWRLCVLHVAVGGCWMRRGITGSSPWWSLSGGSCGPRYMMFPAFTISDVILNV